MPDRRLSHLENTMRKIIRKYLASLGRKGSKVTKTRHGDKLAEWGRRGAAATNKKLGRGLNSELSPAE